MTLGRVTRFNVKNILNECTIVSQRNSDRTKIGDLEKVAYRSKTEDVR
jgi:hypothetical protein